MTGEALLVHNRSPPFISDCIILLHNYKLFLKWSQTKCIKCLMATFKVEVTTTMGDLPLGWPKGGCGRLTEV